MPIIVVAAFLYIFLLFLLLFSLLIRIRSVLLLQVVDHVVAAAARTATETAKYMRKYGIQESKKTKTIYAVLKHTSHAYVSLQM